MPAPTWLKDEVVTAAKMNTLSGSVNTAQAAADSAQVTANSATATANTASATATSNNLTLNLSRNRFPTEADNGNRGHAVGDLWLAPPGLSMPRIYTAYYMDVFTGKWTPATPSSTYVVDHLGTTNIVVACGTIKLRSAYAGPCLRVVRASDSTTLDIGFVKTFLNGEEVEVLDVAAMSAFLANTTGRVDTWYDQSGNATNGLQTTAANRPSVGATWVNGVPSVCFDTDVTIAGGTNKWLNVSGATAFNPRNLGLIVAGRMGQSAMSNTPLQFGTNGYRSFFAFGPSGTPSMLSQGSTFSTFTTPVTPMVGVMTNNSATSKTTFASNSLTNIDVAWNTAPTSTTFTTFNIGGDGSFSSDMRGDVTAWILYKRAFSTQEVQDVRAILARVLNVPTQKPDIVLGCDGDSITYGAGATNLQNRLFYLQGLRPEIDMIYNTALSGTSAADRDGVKGTIWPAMYTPHASARRFIGQITTGRKDLADGATPDATHTLYAGICTYIRSLGFNVRVAASTNTHRTGVAYDTMDAFNSLVRTSWRNYADVLIDRAADPVMGPRGSELNTALVVDGQHPTSLGYSMLASVDAMALKSILA